MSPLDRLRAAYGLTRAPAEVLAALASAPDGQPVTRAFLARCAGRSHRPEAVNPHLVMLRRRVGPGVLTVPRWGVTLTPALREELRELLS